ERRMTERDDAGITEHQVDGKREQNGGKDLRAEREIVREEEIGPDRRDPRQGLEYAEAVATAKRPAHGGAAVGGSGQRGHRASPSHNAMTSAPPHTIKKQRYVGNSRKPRSIWPASSGGNSIGCDTGPQK